MKRLKGYCWYDYRYDHKPAPSHGKTSQRSCWRREKTHNSQTEWYKQNSAKSNFLPQQLYPGTRNPFKEFGVFPPQEPGSQFSPGVVFQPSKKSLHSTFQRCWDFQDRSCNDAAQKTQCFFNWLASRPRCISSVVELPTDFIGKTTLVIQYRHRDESNDIQMLTTNSVEPQQTDRTK